MFPTDVVEGPNGPFLVDLDRSLRSLFQEYGHVINDDLISISDWIRTMVNTGTWETALPTDHVILCDTSGGFVWPKLPFSAEAEPRPYIFKKISGGANQMAVWAQSGDTIDGAAFAATTTAWAVFVMVPDRVVTWYMLHRGAP
jgi:hypothetical protein